MTKQQFYIWILTVLVLCFTMLLPLAFAGDKSYDYKRVSQFASNYDGDTMTVDIQDWPPILGDHVKIRIAGIDTPEIKGKCAQEKALAIKVRDYVNLLLTEGNSIIIRNWKRGTFFRVVADVDIDGIDLGWDLVSKGYAHIYSKKEGKKSWCGHI